MLIVLLVAELVRGRTVTKRVLAVLAVVVVASGVSNFAKLREGLLYLQDFSSHVAAELGALEVAGDDVDPAYRPDPTRAPPVSAEPYFDAVEDHGSPADSPEEIRRRPEAIRQEADTVLPPVASHRALREPPALLGRQPAAGHGRRGGGRAARAVRRLPAGRRTVVG